MNIFKKIRNFFRDIPDNIRLIIESIESLIEWIPIIWKDRDWDQWYLYNIMYKKLYKMEKFYDSDLTYSSTAKQTAKQIRICRILCKRLIDDYYLSNATMFPYDKVYPDFYFLDSEHVLETNYSRIINKKHREYLFSKACLHSEYMHKQDKEYLFKTISKYIDGWWD